MTDQERATAFIVPYLGFDPMESTGDIETLTAEFETVRAEERRAIVDYIRHRSVFLADRIERGDHGITP